LAQVDFDRAAKLVVSNDTPRSEYDRRQAVLLAARADVTAALADVHQIRASLGLPPQPDGGDLGQASPLRAAPLTGTTPTASPDGFQVLTMDGTMARFLKPVLSCMSALVAEVEGWTSGMGNDSLGGVLSI